MEAAASKVLTASGNVGVAGDPIVMYGWIIENDANSAGVCDIYDGSSTGGTKILNDTGVASKGKIFGLNGVGVLFPNGCYVNLDAHVASVTAVYQKVK